MFRRDRVGVDEVAALEEEPEYFFGMDLGKSQDCTALAVIERARLVWPGQRDAATMEFRRETRHRVRRVERARLETPYPAIVSMVAARVERVTVRRKTLVVDATGVGAPVVDLLRAAGLECYLMPLVITGGTSESSSGGDSPPFVNS